MTTLTLTTEQRKTLGEIVDCDEYSFREDGPRDLREFAAYALFLADLRDLAAGHGSLAEDRRADVRAMIAKQGAEWSGMADHDESERLPLVEADDPDWRIESLTVDEDVADNKADIAKHRGRARCCEEMLAMLDAEAVTA